MSVNIILQQDNNSLDCLPEYDTMNNKAVYESSNVSTTPPSSIIRSSIEKLRASVSSITEARDRRASLYETWQRRLPTLFAKGANFTVNSYPPHRAEFARQQRLQSSNSSMTESDSSKSSGMKNGNSHQSWYPHYIMSEDDSSSEPNAEKVEELLKQRRHQSWYPHYTASKGSKAAAQPDASKVNSLKQHTRHQSWYPHYKTASNGTVVA